MFSSALRSILVTLIASAALTVSAAPGLSLKVAAPDTVANVENFKVIVTVTNTGTETLKILNDPLSPLSKLPAETFAISDARGNTPTFTGIRAKYGLSAAINAGAFTTLTPGQSVSIEHDLSKAYNFTSTGEGAYTFEARNIFYIVDTNNNANPLYANIANAHTTKLFGRLAVAQPVVSRRATYRSCSGSQQSQLVSAASQAQLYASSAHSYASGLTSGTQRYNTWFGTYTSSRYNTILSHYSKLNGNTYSSYTYDCTCTDPGTYAYVNPSVFGVVTLCGAFWQAPTAGTDSQGGTLIHESSHFTANGGTQDYTYGQSACQQLALSNPDQAIMNADSHEYFAENNPALP